VVEEKGREESDSIPGLDQNAAHQQECMVGASGDDDLFRLDGGGEPQAQ
jgi:hypothetical protein